MQKLTQKTQDRLATLMQDALSWRRTENELEAFKACHAIVQLDREFGIRLRSFPIALEDYNELTLNASESNKTFIRGLNSNRK